MSLAAGTRLGPYEILAPIGAGGMRKCIAKQGVRPLRRYFFCCGRGSDAGGTIFFIRKYTTMLP